MSLNITHTSSPEADPEMPEISDEELIQRALQFEHIYMAPDGYRAVKTPMTMSYLRNSSCVWAPEFGDLRSFWGTGQPEPFFVRCGYYGMFKPSIAEVLSFVPVERLAGNGFNAFYIGSHIEILRSGGFQRATAYFVRTDREAAR